MGPLWGRKERRRKLGLPEELSEEEKRAEAERDAVLRKEAEAKKVFTFVKPMAGVSSGLGRTSQQSLDLCRADGTFPLLNH